MSDIKDNKYYGKSSLIEIIHQQVHENNEAEKELHDPCKFYPSSVGMCSRRIVYQMLGYSQKPMDPRILLIMENGTYMHERIEKILGDTGLLIAPEISFKKPEWRISGRSDAIIYNFRPHKSNDNIITLKEPIYKTDENGECIRDENGHRIVIDEKVLYEGPDNDVMIVELKSISDSGFKWISKRGPKENHKKQLQLYMYLTGIKEGMLLYENKNTQELKEFFISYDEKLVKEVVNQIVYVNEHVNKKTLPPKEYEENSFECRYCPFRDICWPVRNTYDLNYILGAH